MPWSSHLPCGIFVVLYVYLWKLPQPLKDTPPLKSIPKPTRFNQTAQRELNFFIFCNRKWIKWYTWSGGSSESNCHIHVITPPSKNAFEGLLIRCLWRATNPPACTAAHRSKLNNHSKRVWSSGYDVRLTRERSWVRSSLPVYFLKFIESSRRAFSLEPNFNDSVPLPNCAACQFYFKWKKNLTRHLCRLASHILGLMIY